MYLDNDLVFSDAQAVTASAASASLDMRTATRNAGAGEPVHLVCVVSATAASAGATTLDVALQDSADNSSFADTAVKQSAIPKASLVAGFEILRVSLPRGLRRYLRVNYTVNTANFTAGTFSAYLTVGARQDNVSQPSAFTVL